MQQHESRPDTETWRWHYSPLVGVMYGPIPVGLFIAVPLLLVVLSD